MYRKKIYSIIFAVSLLLPGHLGAQDCDCYISTRAQAVSLMGKKQYSRAIEYLNAAEECPDKPSSNDLSAKREECRLAIKRMEEEARRQKEAEARKREEQNAGKGYMEIEDIEFSNEDVKGNTLTDYGAPLYSSEMRYLASKVKYRGLASESKQAIFRYKIIMPDGTLKTTSDAPAGFSLQKEYTVYSGSNTLYVIGIGNSDKSTYPSGTYTFEFYCEDNLLYTKRFEIRESNTLLVDGKTAVSHNFSSSGGSWTFSVSSGGDAWTTWGIPTWCTVDKYTSSFTLKCEANSSTSSRSDYMKIKCGEKEVRIDITQDGASGGSGGDWRSMLNKAFDVPTYTYNNGKYRGQTNSSGLRDGIGIYAWEGGSFYIGDWDDGDEDGYAVYIVHPGYHVANCDGCAVYVGDWVNDEKSGTGTCYDEQGKLIYYGEFKNDRPTGTYPSSGYSAYKFELKKYTNGSIYYGETKDGKRHGRGLFMWTTGDVWYGRWIDGSRDGTGLYIKHDGTLQHGKWKADEYLGSGSGQYVSGSSGSSSLNGHSYVDLGLPSGLLWATCNVGAYSPSDYGSYFAWGETSPKSSYSWENMTYWLSGGTYDDVRFSKYVASSKYGYVDNITQLEMCDDAARYSWGGSWRMPTKEEWSELKDNCTVQKTTLNGVNVSKLTSKINGAVIYFPLGGWKSFDSINDKGDEGMYFTSSLSLDKSCNAYWVCFFNNSLTNPYANGRYTGLLVRPVAYR